METQPSLVSDSIEEKITLSPPASDTVIVSSPPALAEDEAEVLRIMAAGKQFVVALQQGVQPADARDYDNDDVMGAVSAFDRFFHLDTLHVSGVFIDPNMPGSCTCVISGINDYGRAASVKVYFNQDEPMTWHCPIVYYNSLIDRVMETYLGYLRDNDPYGLAGWLSEVMAPDDEFVREVKRTTDYYNRYYDLSETFIREDQTWIIESGFYSSSEGFMFTVEDAKGSTFQVELGCGDGLCFPSLLQDWQLG